LRGAVLDADLYPDVWRADPAACRPVPRPGPLRSLSMPQLPLRLKSPITSLVGFALLILLGLVPVAATVLDDPFMLTLFTRVVIMAIAARSEEHTSELQSRENLVCRLLLE